MSRVERMIERLADREVDALLVTHLVNVRWLSGFTGTNGAIVAGVGGDGIRRFLTDFRYLTQAADQVGDAFEREIATDLLEQAISRLPDGTRLGFEDDHVTVKQHGRLRELAGDRVELVACGGIVEELRLVKDEDEIAIIRRAAKLADEALQEVLAEGVVGKTERDVAVAIEFAMRRRGASGASFPTIVAAADNGARPHATPREVAIPEGVLLTIDWGCVLDGYASDCTRTFATGGLDPRDREVFDLVLRAQEAALAAVRPGPAGREVDAVAREIIDAAGHAEHFGHGLGHGVGLDVHEGPTLSKRGETALAAGHVVTVEPGVYIPGHAGVRIEDLVVVRDDGAEVLSTLPKHLQTVR